MCTNQQGNFMHLIYPSASEGLALSERENIGQRSDQVQLGPINSQCDPESHDLDRDHNHDHDRGLERTSARISY